MFHVPLHCAWLRWACSGILKEFRSRCSLDDVPALAASWEAVPSSFSISYARIRDIPNGAGWFRISSHGGFGGPHPSLLEWKDSRIARGSAKLSRTTPPLLLRIFSPLLVHGENQPPGEIEPLWRRDFQAQKPGGPGGRNRH